MNSKNWDNAHENNFFKSFEIDRLWSVFSYGPISWGARAISYQPEEEILESATEPFQLIDNISKGNILLKGLETSSSSEADLPESAWFVDANRKIIIGSLKPLPSHDLTGVMGSWQRKLLPPQWTVKEKFNEVFKKIGHIATLESNWDSYGSKPIETDCISRGISILKDLLQWREEAGLKITAPFVAPLSNGGIQFEWEKDTRYFEVSILPKSPVINYLAMDEAPEGELVVEGSLKSQAGIKDLLYWFNDGAAERLTEVWKMMTERSKHSQDEYRNNSR